MSHSFNNLPKPDPIALAHSQRLTQHILANIKQQQGKISFNDYMQMALYEPGLGYYAAGAQKIGPAGDFVTAPEISSLFSRCIAQQTAQILTHIGGGSILEFGAGSGIMAADILLTLAAQDALPDYYYILEVSADLKQRQQLTLQQCIPEYYPRVIWLEQLPEKFSGVILANEVIDAFPVKKFTIEQNDIFEWYVGERDQQLSWCKDAPSSAMPITAIQAIQNTLFTDSYESEINILLAPWLQSVSQCINKGMILLIDYGFPRHEYYHPQRSQGTLMCHYRHHAHTNPLIFPGLQDITAHVDFTRVAESAVAAELTVAGYNTQAAFLLGCGITSMIETLTNTDSKQQFKLKKQLQQLTSPAEMGELFKVMALTRDIDLPLIGYTYQDLRGRL